MQYKEEKNWRKMNSLREMWDTINCSNMYLIEIQGKNNEKGAVRNNRGQKAVMYPYYFIKQEIREKGISLM